MDIEYPVRMQVTLEPVGQPWISIGCAGHSITKQLLISEQFDFDFQAAGRVTLKIAHFDKADTDPTTAVIVKQIGFFNIVDPRFVWAGVYVPEYPSHYQDRTTPLPGQGYLGWNGVYTLDFSVPVFSWMHQTMAMGWLYQ